MIRFIGEVLGIHKRDGVVYAHHGEIVRFSFKNIIGNDGDGTVKIVTDRHAPNYGQEVELWVSNIVVEGE